MPAIIDITFRVDIFLSVCNTKLRGESKYSITKSNLIYLMNLMRAVKAKTIIYIIAKFLSSPIPQANHPAGLNPVILVGKLIGCWYKPKILYSLVKIKPNINAAVNLNMPI